MMRFELKKENVASTFSKKRRMNLHHVFSPGVSSSSPSQHAVRLTGRFFCGYLETLALEPLSAGSAAIKNVSMKFFFVVDFTFTPFFPLFQLPQLLPECQHLPVL